MFANTSWCWDDGGPREAWKVLAQPPTFKKMSKFLKVTAWFQQVVTLWSCTTVQSEDYVFLEKPVNKVTVLSFSLWWYWEEGESRWNVAALFKETQAGTPWALSLSELRTLWWKESGTYSYNLHQLIHFLCFPQNIFMINFSIFVELLNILLNA